MKSNGTYNTAIPLILGLAFLGFPFSPSVFAHCDTMTGPVISDARQALDSGNVNSVLKWVQPEDEGEIRGLFDKTMQVRTRDDEVKELVDQHFFETLVRVHRAGEGAPYTGLKPADTPVEPGIEAAEHALESGSDQAVRDELSRALDAELHARYERVLEAQRHADESVEDGREYVEAYVTYIHYVEGLHQAILSAAAHGHEAGSPDAPSREEAAHESPQAGVHKH